MRTLVIAEAGVNHNGDLDLAKKMVVEAKRCGADIVKFQTAKLELLLSKNAEKAEYQKSSTGAHEKQYDMLKKLLLSYDDFRELNDYCSQVGITFLSTPFDLLSIDFLNELATPFWKIPSGEITNLRYLQKIASTGKPVVLSTGMSTIDEVSAALVMLKENGSGEITLLHCTTEYPAPLAEVNLKAIDTLRHKFGVPVGYSDHTDGIEIAIAAVAMGATIIEKHFTLDKTMEGPDHRASLEPRELQDMVTAIRKVELTLGTGEKKPSISEMKNIVAARKSIVANRTIRMGETFTDENLAAKRPGNGISPMRLPDVLGKKAKRDFAEDELIEI